VEYQLNNSESKLVVTDKDHYDTVNKASVKCPSLREIILLDSDTKMEKTELFENFIRDQPIELREFEVNINDEAAILYTSGTTGNPKGCIADQFYYLNAGRAYVREQIITSKDRILTPLPLFHMNAQTISTMVGLLSGASLILLDRFHPSTWWDDIKKYKANIFHYLGVIPSILMSLPERKDDYNDNTLYGVGAGVLKDIHEKFEKRFNVRLLEIYGSTEAGGVFLTRRGLKDRKVGTGCFGRVFPEAEAMIVDDDDRELPVGQIGELVTRSSDPNNRRKGYFQAYLKNPEATETAWKNGWFHTGDYCKRDAEGCYYFIDRKKDMIRRSGENISATEVESVILLHPEVRDVAAIAVPDKLRVEEVKVYIVVKEGQDLKPEDIINWCEERLAYFKIPRYIEFRKDLPKTETQKIKKLVLKKEKDDLIEDCWDRTVHMKLKRERK
jgi:crotonobetaine/carnitine-CoA ligase